MHNQLIPRKSTVFHRFIMLPRRQQPTVVRNCELNRRSGFDRYPECSQGLLSFKMPLACWAVLHSVARISATMISLRSASLLESSTQHNIIKCTLYDGGLQPAEIIVVIFKISSGALLNIREFAFLSKLVAGEFLTSPRENPYALCKI